MKLTINENQKVLVDGFGDCDLQVCDLPDVFEITDFKQTLASYKTVTVDDIRLITVSRIEPTSAVFWFNKNFSLHFLEIQSWNKTQELFLLGSNNY